VTADRAPTLGEEVASSISHGVGLIAALAAAPWLIASAMRQGGSLDRVLAASVFATTLVILYLASTLYHALPNSRGKRVFRILDHGAVFLLIAGTYTPFTVGVLRGPWGWTLLVVVWLLAGAGVVLTATGGLRYPRLLTASYVGMGWLIVIAIRPLWLREPAAGLLWLLAGGVAYCVGVVFLTAPRLRYHHFVWHLFVLAGSACHVVAALAYAG